MKDLTLTIIIKKPAKAIFDFTLDPKNTPLWIDAITQEETNEWPPKLGTHYRNKNSSGTWREFTLTAFEPSNMFIMSCTNGYHVRYTLKQLNEKSTELEYYEWMDNGELTDVLTMEVLEKLKRVIEAH